MAPDVGQKARRREPAPGGQRDGGARREAGERPAMRALEWNSGIATSRRRRTVRRNIWATMIPMRARRPWVQRQALGAPDVPDVKIR